MLATGDSSNLRDKVRRDLLKQYVRLQRGLRETDPSSAVYQTAIRALRHAGYALIAAGFEDDLERLLRIYVLEGGQIGRTTVGKRPDRTLPELHVLERRPVSTEKSM